MKFIKTTILTSLILPIILMAGSFAFAQSASSASAPSASLEYPAPMTTAQAAARIRARDVGDSRLTSHYYLFETGTGDVFATIETRNFNGDIDIYTAGSMKPLLKATVYASDYASVIQRDFYLRLPSRLILRIQGRTPNDDPAEYKISFTGAFKALSEAAASALPRDPGTPKITGTEDPNGNRATATGAVIVKPKPPVVKATPAPAPPVTVAKNTSKDTKSKKLPTADPNARPPKPTLPVPAPIPAGDKKKKESAVKKASDQPDQDDEDADRENEKRKDAEKKRAAAKRSADTAKAPKQAKSADDPMADVFLEVKMKNGTKLRFAMSDVFSVNVDNGVVKIVLKNGRLINRNLLEIEEMRIGE
jgi:hypothetical protein